ncbi:MAG: branched-chain amino acid ABC transporter permease [Deltaproteobacteria bacterium]|nr:branched-chain amino acid ABC transporter permease [Deltaproteobacteria bacterium]
MAGFSSWLIIVVTLAVAVLVSLGMERAIFRSLRGAEATTLMIASFALSYFLQNLALATMTGFAKSFDGIPLLIKTVTIYQLHIPLGNIVTIVVTTAVLVFLSMFLKRTSLGVQMRAAAEDIITAQLLGVQTNRVVATAFAISGFMAGVVALLSLGQLGMVGHISGVEPLIVAFVAVVLGGMGSLVGAALGGFLVGIIQTVFQVGLPTDLGGYRQAFVFIVVIAILLFRPQGILAQRTTGRKA